MFAVHSYTFYASASGHIPARELDHAGGAEWKHLEGASNRQARSALRWRAFAHDHDLREGDELCFTLTQPLHFVVDILDCHGVLKENALTATNTGKYRVASVCFPYEYVHRPRKRKVREISVTNHEDSGYGVTGATIASRCKTIARERSGGYPSYPSYPNMLRFCHKRKQWECRKEKDGREVVTILDSDEDDEDDEKRLLDHMDLSFGSAQVQSHRMSNTQQLVAYMKQQSEFVPPRSNPPTATGEDQKTVATQTIPAPQIAGHGEELKVAENVDSLHPELTTNQPQASPTEDTTMSNKEGDETHLANLEKSNRDVQIPPETNFSADSKSGMFQSHTIPTPPLEAKHKSVHIVGPLTEKADLPPTKSLEVVTSGGEFLFATLQNIVEMPVNADTMVPITEHPGIPPESVLMNHELIENQEPVSKAGPKESTNELQLSSATKFDKCREFPVNGNPVLPSKTSTTACVLKSKRIPVAKLHRSQTLLAAQAMTKKLRSPSFVAVMTRSNVYTDFSLDIPAEFGKKSRLPVGEAKVTLVCDEVPTMSKAVWIGTNPEQPKLDADAWMEFSRSHFLEEGDVCVFELFNRVTIRIGIHMKGLWD